MAEQSMIYEIEFYRWTDTPEQSEVIRRHSAEFPNLDAAKDYGLSKTGTPNSPQEADGFTVRENGVVRSEVIIKHRTSNA
jgi:hypothetical protein